MNIKRHITRLFGIETYEYKVYQLNRRIETLKALWEHEKAAGAELTKDYMALVEENNRLKQMLSQLPDMDTVQEETETGDVDGPDSITIDDLTEI